MKFLTGILLFIVFSSSAYSATYTASGKVAMMRSHADYWGSNAWVQIEGFNGIEDCEEFNHGKGSFTYIAIPSTENQIYSMLLSAFMAGKTVEIDFSTELTNGLCTIRFATLSQ